MKTKTTNPTETIETLGGIFTYIIALLALSSWFVACSTSPTGRTRANLVPAEQLNQMGDQAWEETKKKYPETKDQGVKDFVNRVAGRVVAASGASDQKWDVVVFDSKEINAFALPGGHIGVFTGIIPVTQNEAGLAAVLGHETSHVTANHSAERVSDELIAQGALGLASKALSTSALHGPLMAALGLGTQVGVLLPFSRAQESEADELGLMVMARAGFDPSEAVQFWQRMQAQGGQEPPAILSSHPASSERVSKLQSLLGKAQAEYANASQKSGTGARAPASQ